MHTVRCRVRVLLISVNLNRNLREYHHHKRASAIRPLSSCLANLTRRWQFVRKQFLDL